MPCAVVDNNVKGAKTSAAIVGEALEIGRNREAIPSIVDQSGDEARSGVSGGASSCTPTLPWPRALDPTYALAAAG